MYLMSCMNNNFLNIFYNWFMIENILLSMRSIINCCIRHNWFGSKHDKKSFYNRFQVDINKSNHQKGIPVNSLFGCSLIHYLRVKIQVDRQDTLQKYKNDSWGDILNTELNYQHKIQDHILNKKYCIHPDIEYNWWHYIKVDSLNNQDWQSCYFNIRYNNKLQ